MGKTGLSVAGSALSLVRRSGWLAVLALMVAAVGPARAEHGTNHYGVTMTPATAVVGTSAEHTLTLTNSFGSILPLGGADVQVPTAAGLTVTAPAAGGEPMTVTASDGLKRWTVSQTADGQTLRFRAATPLLDGLLTTQTVSAQIEVAASCSAQRATWTTTALDPTALPGDEFQNAASDPDLTVLRGGKPPVALAFTSQLTEASAGGELDDVTVAALDTCGDVVTDAVGEVSISIGDDPSGGGARLGGTLSQPLVNGVATFDDLSIDGPVGPGYTLRAEYGALSAESDAFTVVVVCTSSSQSCFVDDGTTRVETPIPTGDATMALGLGPAAPIAPCDATRADPVGSWATIEPNGYSEPTTTVTMTYAKAEAPGTGVANFIVCFWNEKQWLRLADCSRQSPKPTAPCISKRNRTGVGELVIELLIKTADPIGGTYS